MTDRDTLQEMSDEALIRASLEKETYDRDFLERVGAELKMRGLAVATFADHILLRQGDTVDSCSIETALQVFDDLEVWNPTEWENALGDRITIQRGTEQWLAHRQDEAGYVESARFDQIAARKSLESFLTLEHVAWPSPFDLTTWPIVDATPSRKFLQRVSRELTEQMIEHIVISPASAEENQTFDIRVPDDQTLAAEKILSELYARIEELQQQAQKLADTDERKKELEVYELLKELVPGKAAVVYNHASVLYELGELDRAIEGWLEAMSMGMPEEKLSEYRGNRTGLFQMTSLTAGKMRYPDYFKDIEAYLHKVESQITDNTSLLHGLATLSRINDDSDGAIGYYGRILDIEPDDQIARTNLAMLQSQEEAE